MDIGEMVLDSMDCIHLAEDRDWWQVIVNTVMNFEVT
jgi:hypothetical protein